MGADKCLLARNSYWADNPIGPTRACRLSKGRQGLVAPIGRFREGCVRHIRCHVGSRPLDSRKQACQLSNSRQTAISAIFSNRHLFLRLTIKIILFKKIPALNTQQQFWMQGNEFRFTILWQLLRVELRRRSRLPQSPATPTLKSIWRHHAPPILL